LGVECISGDAEILTPHLVRVNGREISTKNIIIASGAKPAIPNIPSLDNINYYTSDTIWDLKKRPNKMVVLGGGAIGCELAQCFSKIGTSVTQIVRGERLLKNEDPEVSSEVLTKFLSDGVTVKTSTEVISFRHNKESTDDNEKYILVYKNKTDETKEIYFDTLLLAAGRKANTQWLNIKNTKEQIKLSPDRSIEVNEYLQTNIKNIFACGDVIGSYQFTHVASHQAWFASVNCLFGVIKKFKVNYSVIPRATFIEPEVARVGFNEQEARSNGIEYELSQYNMDDLDRAIADDEDYGFVRVLTKKGTDKIIGVTIVGYHASEIIAEYVLAMKHNIGLNKILSTIHIYPTYNEANKYVAGVWKRANTPHKLLKLVGKFHSWMRRL
jgi:pyruvate/2-oxoglutarate dehydrogenase complex dihydrolipoamide dehydrogenase (E3) component